MSFKRSSALNKDLFKYIFYLIQDPDQVLESGEETYFPALRIGVEKSSAVVSFFMSSFTIDLVWWQ